MRVRWNGALAGAAIFVASASAAAQVSDDTSPTPAATEVVVAVDADVPPETGPPEGEPGLPVYEPLATARPGDTLLQARLLLRERVESVGSFAVDRDGTMFEPGTIGNGTIRLGGTFDSQRAWAPIGLRLDVEGDVLTGTHMGATTGDPLADDLPNDDEVASTLRKAFARFSVTTAVHAFGGVTTSHWGLGLLANDGDHGWSPGSAYFSDPRGGDRVIRGGLMLGPFSSQHLAIMGGYDVVLDDDALRDVDDATQAIVSAVWGWGQPTNAGAYVVMRDQEAPDGARTEVVVIDVAGTWVHEFDGLQTLTTSLELAGITGTTDLSPSVDFPRNDVRQLGSAVRVSYDARRWGVVADGVYASGDRNFDDGEQTGFRMDPNFHLGQIFHRYVWSAWTARGVVTASDPDLVGVPSEDLDRLTSRGAVTNTVAFFPRGWWRPVDEIELYGGPLFAWSATDAADPFNTRMAGGDPRNALDGDPGRYLATEVDLGIRYRQILAGTELVIGLEGAGLFPGAGMRASGSDPGTIWGGRFIASYRL